jgi:hypothetical protein
LDPSGSALIICRVVLGVRFVQLSRCETAKCPYQRTGSSPDRKFPIGASSIWWHISDTSVSQNCSLQWHEHLKCSDNGNHELASALPRLPRWAACDRPPIRPHERPSVPAIGLRLAIQILLVIARPFYRHRSLESEAHTWKEFCESVARWCIGSPRGSDKTFPHLRVIHEGIECRNSLSFGSPTTDGLSFWSPTITRKTRRNLALFAFFSRVSRNLCLRMQSRSAVENLFGLSLINMIFDDMSIQIEFN